MELVLSFDLVLQGSTCPPLHTYTCGRICAPHQKILASSIIRYEWNFLTLILLDFLEILRLNLINHFVGFIPCQFACNSALRNPVFMWESCKGSVWESVKKSSRLCTQQGDSWLDLMACSRLASHQMMHTSEAWRGAKQSCQLEHYWTKSLVWPFN